MKLASQAGKLFAAAVVLSASIAARAATPTFTTLYSFTAGGDGGYPQGTLAIDNNGVLYGTTRGGANGVGNVYSMTPPSSPGGSWTQTVLYSFTGGSDGRFPFSGVVRGPGGALYGVTAEGGANEGGVVFAVTPPASSGESWTENVLYNFTSGSDGGYPTQALVRGSDGTLYGTTVKGGANGGGVVFALSPPSSPGASWTEHVLFSNSSLGFPIGLTYFGGRLYGGIQGNGSTKGAIFSLTPPTAGGGAWTWDAVYRFTGGSDGGDPLANLVGSPDGVLYGTTYSGGAFGYGTAFSLTPPATAGAAWTLATIYNFTQDGGGWGDSLLLVPGSGVLFGAANGAGYQDNGALFELNPPGSAGGAWTYTTLHYFPQQGSDDFPGGGLTVGPGRVLYGVTFGGGIYTFGSVFALQL